MGFQNSSYWDLWSLSRRSTTVELFPITNISRRTVNLLVLASKKGSFNGCDATPHNVATLHRLENWQADQIWPKLPAHEPSSTLVSSLY